MKKNTLCLLLCSVVSSFAFAQKGYFQQDVAYTIQVTLDDKNDELRGFENLIYKNNSPDELTYIYMHLWPNAYHDNNTALGHQLKEDGNLFFYYAKAKDRGYIDSLNFKVDGVDAELVYDKETPDIAKLFLPHPLQPGGQISITTPFHVKIPAGVISRLGHIGQQYQITQWYPKPAVYDRNGWNQIPYLNQGEFYSEFGTYDVFITLPKNYVLGSTGDLIDNPEEKKFLDDLAEKTKDISSYDKKDDSFPESSSELKTVHYHQEHVHDFAWFCDKRYHVLKGEVELPHTKKKVTTWVMFTNQYADLWKKSISYVNDALYYYSLWNGDYTYDVCTAVDGALSAGGGMEYPNITVIGGVQSDRMLDIVITHEVGHNWFYGMLGSNERRHAWMDEGINSANEMRYTMTKYPDAHLASFKGAHLLGVDQYKAYTQYYQLYNFCERQHIDQSDDLPSAEYTEINYGAIVYMKSAVIFNYLRAYLGDTLYDKCFQTYFDRWHWHHPMPEDIKAVFEEVSHKDLGWVFNDLILTTKQLDYKICNFLRVNSEIKAPGIIAQAATTDSSLVGQYGITVKNCGDINGPFAISGMKNGSVVKTQWYEGFSGKQTMMFPAGDYDAFKIDAGEALPEANRKNNTMKTSGLLKKAEPFKLQIAGSLNDPNRTQLFWMPVMGYNRYDKFMLGAAVYNHVLPGKHFEWTAMPMFSFGDKSLVGHADAFFNIWPSIGAQQIRIGANANRYHFYTVQPADFTLPGETPDRRLGFTKIAPEITIDFDKPRARSPISQSVRFRAVWLKTDYIANDLDYTTGQLSWHIGTQENTFYEVKYSFDNNRPLHPFDFSVLLQGTDNMIKTQVTGNFHINYNAKKRIDIRVFGGYFIDNLNAGPYRFRMSGWGPLGLGNHDYLFDYDYFGRSENGGNLASQQMVIEDGGFKIYSPVGQSDKWLGAVNLVIPSPSKNKILGRIKLYADAGMYGTTGLDGSEFVFDAGLQFTLLRNGICDVYFPLVHSQNIKDYYSANGLKYGDMIRFTFNLKPVNPFNIVRKIQI